MPTCTQMSLIHLSRLPRLDPAPNHQGSLPARTNSKACMHATHLYAPSLQVQLPVLTTHNAHIHIIICEYYTCILQASLTISSVLAGVCVLDKRGRMRGIRATYTVYNSDANVLQAVELLSGIIKDCHRPCIQT